MMSLKNLTDLIGYSSSIHMVMNDQMFVIRASTQLDDHHSLERMFLCQNTYPDTDTRCMVQVEGLRPSLPEFVGLNLQFFS